MCEQEQVRRTTGDERTICEPCAGIKQGEQSAAFQPEGATTTRVSTCGQGATRDQHAIKDATQKREQGLTLPFACLFQYMFVCSPDHNNEMWLYPPARKNKEVKEASAGEKRKNVYTKSL